MGYFAHGVCSMQITEHMAAALLLAKSLWLLQGPLLPSVAKVYPAGSLSMSNCCKDGGLLLFAVPAPAVCLV